MASVEERLKMKRGRVDPWSTKERLCLAQSVARSGNQNWMSVSRSLRVFGGEPGRPADWFSQKSCAVQYDNLLTQIETPKRKKRGADGSKAEGPDLTPAEVIVKQLTVERIEELRKLMAEARAVYMKEKEELYLVQNGLADDKLDEMIAHIQEEKRQEKAEQEEHQRWLRQREERKEMEMAWRPHAAQNLHTSTGSTRRPSNQSERGSETDNVESPSSSDQPSTTEETVEHKPASTPTSPLLTSLLKSPSPVTGSQSSILHSAITSQRGASPTITSLLNSSPGIPSTSASIPLSPNLKSLVSNALAGHDDVPKPQSHSASSSPTLSMLLELPPSSPGKLPELPYSATKQPVSTPTSKPGEGKEQSTVDILPEVEGPQLSEQYQSFLEPVLEVEEPEAPKNSPFMVEPTLEGETVRSPKLHQLVADSTTTEQGLKSPEQNQGFVKSPTKVIVEMSKCSEHDQLDIEALSTENSDSPKTKIEPFEDIKSLELPFKGWPSPEKSYFKSPSPSEFTERSLSLVKILKEPKVYQQSVKDLIQVYNSKSLKETNLIVEASHEDVHKEPEQFQHGEEPLPVEVQKPQDQLEAVEINLSSDYVEKSLETSLSKNNETPDLSLHEQSSESHHSGDLSIGTTPALSVKPAVNVFMTTKSEASRGKGLDPLKKELLPDINNMEMVMPVQSETKAPVAESKDKLDDSDRQQIASDEVEYVVDPSILQELVPEGLVDEMADFIVISDDVEADVSNMLVPAESTEAYPTEQVESKLDEEANKDSENVTVQEQKHEKQNDSVPVVVHSPPVQQSPQRTIVTPSSVVTSPRGGGRPSKGSMIARKIVMEEEVVPKTEIIHDDGGIQQLEEASETLSSEDLEKAGVLVELENGELVKLSVSGHMDDIRVIQDSSNSGVVVVSHEDVKDSDSNQSSQSATESPLEKQKDVEKSTCLSPRKDDQSVERKSPGRTPRKAADKNELNEPSPVKKPGIDPKASILTDLPGTRNDEAEKTQLEVQSGTKEPTTQDETSHSADDIKEDESVERSDPLSPTLKKQKLSSAPVKREKSPGISESSNDVVSEEDSKGEAPEGSKKYDDLQSNEKESLREKARPVHIEDEDTRHVDNDVHVALKEEKVRAETPSTEDDNTRDTEPAPPVKRGRGRYARDSTTNSDSLPNSPVPTHASHDDEKEHRAWKKSIMLVYNRIAAHKNASIFLKPITDDIAPGYSSMIYKPLDLQTIKKNIEIGVIRNTNEFQRDILRMFNNAIMYNKSGSPINDMAREMQEEGATHLEEYKNTQLYLQNVGAEGGLLPSRRGTRTAEKRDFDSEGFGTRRGLADKGNSSKSGVFSTGLLGKRKRSLPDDKSTPKRRKDDD